MRVFTYHTIGGKDLILKYLDSLPNDESALGYAIIDRLSKHGFDALDGLTTRQIKNKLWEIKFRKNNRIFYIVVENGCVYLLHACKKQKGKAELFDIQKAEKRMNEVLNQYKIEME